MTDSTDKKTRRYARAKMSKGLMVAWQVGTNRAVSRVTTVGLGGVFIETPNPPAAGTLVQLIFPVPLGEVRARGVVRSSEPSRGMGLQFTAMSLTDRERLYALLKKLLG